MPILSGTVGADGALVDVQFGLSATAVKQLRAHLSPIVQPLTVRAVIDTGAEMTCLDTALVQALRLPAHGFTPANVPAIGGLTFQSQHDAGFAMLHPSGNASDNLLVGDLLILEVSLAGLGFQALVGRDVLARCRFLYDGIGDRFELSY